MRCVQHRTGVRKPTIEGQGSKRPTPGVPTDFGAGPAWLSSLRATLSKVGKEVIIFSWWEKEAEQQWLW